MTITFGTVFVSAFIIMAMLSYIDLASADDDGKGWFKPSISDINLPATIAILGFFGLSVVSSPFALLIIQNEIILNHFADVLEVGLPNKFFIIRYSLFAISIAVALLVFAVKDSKVFNIIKVSTCIYLSKVVYSFVYLFLRRGAIMKNEVAEIEIEETKTFLEILTETLPIITDILTIAGIIIGVIALFVSLSRRYSIASRFGIPISFIKINISESFGILIKTLIMFILSILPSLAFLLSLDMDMNLPIIMNLFILMFISVFPTLFFVDVIGWLDKCKFIEKSMRRKLIFIYAYSILLPVAFSIIRLFDTDYNLVIITLLYSLAWLGITVHHMIMTMLGYKEKYSYFKKEEVTEKDKKETGR